MDKKLLVSMLISLAFVGQGRNGVQAEALAPVPLTERQVINTNETVKIENNSFNSLQYNGNGGAIYNSGDLTIKNTDFTNNSANEMGGAIHNSNGQLKVTNSTFTGNKIDTSNKRLVNVSSISSSWKYNEKTNTATMISDDGKTITETPYIDSSKGEIYIITYTTDDDGNSVSNREVIATFEPINTKIQGGAISSTNGTLNIENSKFNDNHVLYNEDKNSPLTDITILGGAIESSGNLNIKNSEFNNNSAFGTFKYSEKDENGKTITRTYQEGKGGAIAIENADLTVSDSIFQNNASVDGGAIASSSNLDIKNSEFNNNSALGTFKYSEKDENGKTITRTYQEGSGGAIAIRNEDRTIFNYLTVSDSIFQNNTSVDGGAICHVNANTVIHNSTFINNNALLTKGDTGENYHGSGGAINTSGDLNNLTISDSTFIGNTAGYIGGAIANDDGIGNITVINSTFKNNQTLWDPNIQQESNNINKTLISDGSGGAIYAGGNSWTGKDSLNIKKSVFENNISSTNAGGVASYCNNANISDSIFTQNIAKSGDGGAITFLSLYPFFQNFSGSEEPVGKVIIENTMFNGNQAKSVGGAIANYISKMYITDSNFKNNSAKIGGAIATGDDLTITALNQNVTFSGNNADKGGDIYIGDISDYTDLRDNPDQPIQLNLNVNTNRTITFDGGITGQNAVININNPENSLYEDLNSNGTIIVNNYVQPDKNSYLDVNIYNGSLNPSDENYLKDVNLTIEENGTLDLRNGKTGLVSIGDFTSNNGSIAVDVDFNSDQTFDWIESESGQGTLNIKDVNLVSDMKNGVNSYDVSFDDKDVWEDLEIKTPENGINSVTHDYVYNTNIEDRNLSINRLTDEDGNAIKVDGFTLAVNQTDTINGKEVSLQDERTFTAQKDITITGKNLEKGWTGELGGKSLTVNGNGYKLDGESNKGFSVGQDQTLTFNDTNITGFNAENSKDSVFTINDNGTLNLNDVKVSGTNSVASGTNKDTVINLNNVQIQNNKSGIKTAGSVNISGKSVFDNNGNGIEVTSEDSIITLNGLDGDGYDVTFNDKLSGVKGAKLNLKAGNVEFHKPVSNLDINMDGTTASLKADNLFNGQNLTVAGVSNINMANNSVGTMSLNSLTLNDNLNVGVDVDLANKSMDRISAKSYNLGEYKVNVSQMNLLSDAKEVRTDIQFADEGLKNNVTTSVSEVAYSPIYKYGVNYNKDNGDFEFTRSSGSGGSPSYNDLNPSVMASPIAAQMGGYMGMIDNYNNAFNHMDMYMLKPESLRAAENNNNKYAISDGSAPYSPVETNTNGVWVRPYSGYDSVGLKNGPKVHNASYGTFIGGDFGMHEFDNGFTGSFSPYISYQGAHQSYAGNSVYQNGGTLGFTGTVYKGKFFSGITAGVGANIAEASTMYGNEDFPMLMTGVASKTGYNIEFKGGKFIIQPSVMVSYTYVDNANYTNAGGVRINSAALHAVQISPNLRFSFNTKNYWQPYAFVGMNWNIMNNDGTFKANMTSLPELSVKPYVQYGIGIQKLVNDNFTAFAQFMMRSGGRNGVAGTLGMKYLFGGNNRPMPEQQRNVL